MTNIIKKSKPLFNIFKEKNINTFPLHKQNITPIDKLIVNNSNNNIYELSSSNKKYNKWTKEDDNKLTFLIQKYSSSNWKEISLEIKKFSPIQCLHRWTKVINPDIKKGYWTENENNILINWVKNKGSKKWTECSKLISGRTGKQCREHYLNIITKNNKKLSWSLEEDFTILYLIKKYGTNWVKISEYFTNRNENHIKNRFYCNSKKYICEKENIDKKNKDLIKINKIKQYFDEIYNHFANSIENKQSIIFNIEKNIKEYNSKSNNNNNSEINEKTKKINEYKNNDNIKINKKTKFIKKFYRIFKKHKKPQFNYTFKIKGKNLKNIPIKIIKIKKEIINNKLIKIIYFNKIKKHIFNIKKIYSKISEDNLFNKSKIFKLKIKNSFSNKNINEKKLTKKGKIRIRRQPYNVPIRNRNDIVFVSFIPKQKKIYNKKKSDSLLNITYSDNIDLTEPSIEFFNQKEDNNYKCLDINILKENLRDIKNEYDIIKNELNY